MSVQHGFSTPGRSCRPGAAPAAPRQPSKPWRIGCSNDPSRRRGQKHHREARSLSCRAMSATASSPLFSLNRVRVRRDTSHSRVIVDAPRGVRARRQMTTDAREADDSAVQAANQTFRCADVATPADIDASTWIANDWRETRHLSPVVGAL